MPATTATAASRPTKVANDHAWALEVVEGDTINGAATHAYSTLAAPMLTGTLITIAGFVPIGFAQSGAGEYTISLFQVVAIALIASWLVAVLFTPILGSVLLKASGVKGDAQAPGPIIRTYLRFLGTAMRFPWITFALSAALLALSLLGLQNINRQFFPPSDRLELMVDLQMPRSTSIFASEEAVGRVEDWLAANEDVDFWSAYIGRSVIRFYLPLAIEPPTTDRSQLVVVANDLAGRLRLEEDLDAWLIENFPEATTRVSPLEMGPPVGWPLQYRISGPDAEVLRAQALRLAEAIATDPAADRIHFDWMEPARQVRIEVDQDRARRLGLSSMQLANTLNAAVSGSAVTQVRDGIYLVNVVVRAAEGNRVSLDTLPTLQVPLPGGRTAALSQFATFTFDQEQPLIWRRDRQPTLTVLAGVRAGARAESVVAAIEDDNGKLSPRIKLSETAVKTSVPGVLQVGRVYRDSHALGDGALRTKNAPVDVVRERAGDADEQPAEGAHKGGERAEGA